MAEKQKRVIKVKGKNAGEISKLQQLTSNVDEVLFGTSSEFNKENVEDINSIRDAINKVKNTYKKNTGEDVMEFLNRFNFEQKKNSNDVNPDSEHAQELNKIEEMLEQGENPLIMDLFAVEGDRFRLYGNYDLIYEHIPQMAQALDTFVDNIISPDDFTKDIFNLFFKDEIVRHDSKADEDSSQVIKNLKELETMYDVEGKATSLIRDTLKYGDQFAVVLKLDKEFNKILTESSPLSHGHDNQLSESTILVEDSEISEIQGLKLFSEDSDIKAEITRCINENIEFSDDLNSLLENNYLYQNDFNKKKLNKDEKFMNTSLNNPNRKEKNDDTSLSDKGEGLSLPGSVFKVLDPRRVIKLEYDGIVYGYYYMEKSPEESERLSQIDGLSRLGGSGVNPNPTTTMGNSQNASASDREKNLVKYRTITDIFIKNISKKIDKEFVLKNKEFKNTIYNYVKNGYILEKKMKITYIPPNEMIHFVVHKDEEYGNSIYRKILFIAKLYLMVLQSTFMSKLVRSPEKRVFYIEVGLENDAQGAVQSFVRDIKNKEFKMSNFKDINTVLNYPGLYHDYYIPVVNGDKPVEIDTLQGMDVQMDNDFLEYLLKAMISGIGIPPDFLNYSEQTEFARSLAMQNGKFVRSIIHYQKQFSEFFSNVYRKLYKNEYGYDDVDEENMKKTEGGKDNSSGKKDKMDYTKIEVRFQPPSSLNMSNLNEQINNSRDIIDFIVTTVMGDQGDENAKVKAKKEVAKDMVPSIDWDKYEKIIDNSLVENVREQVLTSSGEDDGMDTGGY